MVAQHGRRATVRGDVELRGAIFTLALLLQLTPASSPHSTPRQQTCRQGAAIPAEVATRQHTLPNVDAAPTVSTYDVTRVAMKAKFSFTHVLARDTVS